MNIGELAIRKKTITLVMTVLIVFVGMAAYDDLGRLEDPEFTIKDGLIVTSYPGASAEDVENEVTIEIEKACQQLGQLKRVASISQRGLSVVTATIKDQYDRDSLPQVWDELRRKITEAQSSLPPGCGTSVVNDDFGDVFGVYIAITGDGYTQREIKDFADMLRRELLLVQDVKKIDLWGVQPEVVYVEMKRDVAARLGITPEQIFNALQAKNLVADGGRVYVGPEHLTINPSGYFTSEEQFRDLLITQPGSESIIHLGDVAEIKRGYRDPPDRIMRSSAKTLYRAEEEIRPELVTPEDLNDPTVDIVPSVGQPAIGLGISTVLGGNVVTMGAAIEERAHQLVAQFPVGISVDVISVQYTSVTKSINAFMVNLAQAIGIVVVVLLIFMGLRSGLLIGFILFLTICATFIVMKAQGVLLERISLGALIIALGMLVDNAIVVTEGMKLKIEAGEDKLAAARSVVAQNQFPLLGATFVAVLAFGPIGLSDDSTGEYCRSLFQVLLISLIASWLTAVTVTPLLCTMLFHPKKGAKGGEADDPYKGFLFRGYRWFLEFCIRMRFATILVVMVMFVLAVLGFGQLRDSFFPQSTRNQFMVDVWMPEGSSIRETEKHVADLEEFCMSLDSVSRVASHIGGGAMRFLLTYSPEKSSNPAYAQLLVSVFDPNTIEDDRTAIQAWMDENLPQCTTFTKQFKLGPGEGGNLQVRFSGPDEDVLRHLADQAMNILEDDGGAQGTRSDWRDRVKVVRPVLAEAQASRNGIDRVDVCQRLQASFDGLVVGSYREGEQDTEDRVLDVVFRPPPDERLDVSNIQDIQIYSPAAERSIPLRQILTGFDTVYESPIIQRRNRRPTITVHCDQISGEVSSLLNRVKVPIEQMAGVDIEAVVGRPVPDDRWRPSTITIVEEGLLPLKAYPGHYMAWGPEAEDSARAQAALAGNIPMFLVGMILIVIILFNNLRQPLIIWLTVPLALIGISAGLLLFDQPFNFMAVLGALSLSGMLIKNAIVLIDQVNANLAEGTEPYEAVVGAGVSRMRPVMMAAATTVLGMAPLLSDAFFVAMSVAVMFGLTFATVLTLIFVPTLYTTLYWIKSPKKG